MKIDLGLDRFLLKPVLQTAKDAKYKEIVLLDERLILCEVMQAPTSPEMFDGELIVYEFGDAVLVDKSRIHSIELKGTNYYIALDYEIVAKLIMEDEEL